MNTHAAKAAPRHHRYRRWVALALSVVLSIATVLPMQVVRAAPGDTTTYYFLTNHLGSVDVVLDEDGDVVERRDYLPYGEDRHVVREADAPKTDLGFTGQRNDEETDLYYYGARYYDSETGRFISLDPWEGDLTDPQSLNKYSYARNNPARFIDPTGESFTAAAAVVLAVAGAFFSGIQPANAPDVGDSTVPAKPTAQVVREMAQGEVAGGLVGGGAGLLLGAVAKPLTGLLEYGIKTVEDMQLFRKLVGEGAGEATAASEVLNRGNIADAQQKIESYLGENARRIQNPNNGNIIYQSEDGLREVRFDVGDPTPHENVHTHVVEYEAVPGGKKRRDNRSAFPSDVKDH